MEHFKDLTILSETDESYIGICSCCSTINLVYKNIAIKFPEEEFNIFRDYIEKIKPEDFIFESRTGKNIFMATPVKNIVLCFSTSEIWELKAMMTQASLMLEVNRILK
ncbi:MAG: DUF6686 family protein [Cytophagaceae bacterium]